MLLQGLREDGGTFQIRLREVQTSKPITIGRGKDADVTIDDGMCSRVHCAIRYWDDIFVIRDKNSRNGVVINGEKVEVAALHPGDVVKIGDTELTVLSEETNADVTIMQ